jgi:peptidoglycan/LPS O-acetylase OafA/YrhL
MSAGAAPRSHYLTLDAARGVAALLVLTFHLDKRILPSGYLAVDFFFLLSGVVVASAYERRLLDGMRFRDFAWIRLKRLYPLYVAGVLIGLVAALLPLAFGRALRDPAGLALSFASALAMAPGLVAGTLDVFPLNSPAWSLFCELGANAVYGRFIRWMKSPVLVLLALGGLATAGASLLLYGSLAGGALWDGVWAGYGRVAFGFFAGVLMFRLSRQRAPTPSNLGALAMLGLLAGAVIAVPSPMPYDLVVAALAFPALVWWGMRVQPGGWLARVAERAGPLSYALYATHGPVLAIVKPQLLRAHVSPPVFVAVSAVAALAVAWAAERLWDRPIRRWLNARPRRPARAGDLAAEAG